MRFTPLLLVLACTTGCVGSIGVEDGESFGAVGSAAAVSLSLSNDTAHFLLASTGPGVCGKVQDAMNAMGAAWDDWDLSTEDDRCEAFYGAARDAWDPLLRSSPRLLDLTVQDGLFVPLLGDLDDWTELRAGRHDVNDGELTAVSTWFDDGNPYELLADRGGCPDSGDLDDALETVRALHAEDGTLELEEASSGAWQAAVELTLPDDGGALDGSFAASPCEAELTGVDQATYLLGMGWFKPWL